MGLNGELQQALEVRRTVAYTKKLQNRMMASNFRSGTSQATSNVAKTKKINDDRIEVINGRIGSGCDVTTVQIIRFVRKKQQYKLL